MTVNRIIRGGLCFKVSKVKICNELKIDLPIQHIHKTAAIFIHKHMSHMKCHSLLNQLRVPKRKASPIYVKKPQVGNYAASLDKCIEVYNRQPTKVKEMTLRQFKKYLMKGLNKKEETCLHSTHDPI